jgi:hypothetical protein
MGITLKRLIILGLGILAGILVWPFIELLIVLQGYFPSFLIFSITMGALFGGIFGAVYGTGEGIIASSRRRIVRGALTGFITGFVGGTAGFLFGQWVLFLLGQYLFISYRNFTYLGLPIARAAGWAVTGIFIGIIEGIRAGSNKKIGIGVLGGFLGGLLGGAVIEYSRILIDNYALARLIGFLVFGASIAAFYALIERKMSYGVLRILNGPYKGREYILNNTVIRIGLDEKNDIILKPYRHVVPVHAVIRAIGDDLVIEKGEDKASVFLNDEMIKEKVLKYEDVIKIGSAKFYYRHE